MSNQSTTMKSQIPSPRPLPAGWRWVKLGTLGPLVDGDWILNADYMETGVRLFQVGDVGCGQFVGKSSRFISADRATELRCTLLHAGDILISRMPDPIGRACILPDLGYPCITAVDVSIWRLHGENVIADVLVAYLNTEEWYQRVLNQASGATRPRISRTKLQDLEIPLPPLAEQQRLTGMLKEQMGAVEKARAAAQARLAAVKGLPAAFLRLVFPQPGQPLPDGWRWVKLGEVCEIKGGKRLPNGTDFVSYCTPFPYIRVVDFKDGTVDTRNLRYLDKVTQSAISRYTIEKDDVYISIAGSIGIVGTIPECLDGANLTENAAKLVICDKDDICRDYLANFLTSSMGQGSISERTNTVGQPKLALTRIATIPVPLPPLSEQQQIAGVLRGQMAKVEKARAAAEEELNMINTLPATLLRRAFNGEL
jgi:type I restriction enzyme S subunit